MCKKSACGISGIFGISKVSRLSNCPWLIGSYGKKGIYFISILQIVLLISFSFSFAFIMNKYVGVGSATLTGLSENGGLDTATAGGATTAGGGDAASADKKKSSGDKKKSDDVKNSGDKKKSDEISHTQTPVKGKKPDISLGGLMGGKLFGTKSKPAGAMGALLGGLSWGGIVYAGISFLGPMLGFDSTQTSSIAMAAGVGFFTSTALTQMGANGVLSPTNPLVTYAPLIGLGIGLLMLYKTYKKKKVELVRFECLPWEAPIRGEKCELCGEDGVPCSEYRCKSLGQACSFENAGTDNEICVWKSRDDTQSPRITPWDDALGPQTKKNSLRYVGDGTRPPSRGAKIEKEGTVRGCLQAFTQLQFGITTDEAAQCKIDFEDTPGTTYENMSPTYFGETNLLLKEHKQILKIPNPFGENSTSQEDLTIPNSGTYTLYVRCRDANGNYNVDSFAFSFCVDKAPDTTAPEIMGTSIASGSAVREDVESVPIDVYTNEPTNCKWSRMDQAYEAMPNVMSCANELYQVNADLNYVCSTQLTGIINREINNFFFRCQDLSTAPGGVNTMLTSEPFSLRGTEGLTIRSVGPEGVFEGSTSTVVVNLTVETANGADEGKSRCGFDLKGDGNYNIMSDTGGIFHSQPLDFFEGEHTIKFRCLDSGNNAAEGNTTFTVKVDRQNALIVRMLREGDNLKLITSEDARCVYSQDNCNYNFEDGLTIPYENSLKKNIHIVKWDPKLTYHIQCEDLQGNRPSPDTCSVIVQGSNF